MEAKDGATESTSGWGPTIELAIDECSGDMTMAKRYIGQWLNSELPTMMKTVADCVSEMKALRDTAEWKAIAKKQNLVVWGESFVAVLQNSNLKGFSNSSKAIRLWKSTGGVYEKFLVFTRVRKGYLTDTMKEDIKETIPKELGEGDNGKPGRARRGPSGSGSAGVAHGEEQAEVRA